MAIPAKQPTPFAFPSRPQRLSVTLLPSAMRQFSTFWIHWYMMIHEPRWTRWNWSRNCMELYFWIGKRMALGVGWRMVAPKKETNRIGSTFSGQRWDHLKETIELWFQVSRPDILTHILFTHGDKWEANYPHNLSELLSLQDVEPSSIVRGVSPYISYR